MKALLVDGFNLVRRIYAAVPKPDEHADANPEQLDAIEQNHVNGVIESSTASLQRALNFHRPSHCLVVFEQQGRTWRHRLFPDYKKKRSAMPQPLAAAMPRLRQAFEHIGVACFDKLGFEADDVIATMATKIANNDSEVVILSTDRNHCQLLAENVTVYDHFNQRPLDREMIQKKFGVEPHQLPFALALAGDSGLSIPGIPTIGIRTAARLVNEYGSLDKLIAASKDMSGKLGTKLYNGEDDARLGLILFTLKIDIDLGINLNQFRYQSNQ